MGRPARPRRAPAHLPRGSWAGGGAAPRWGSDPRAPSGRAEAEPPSRGSRHLRQGVRRDAEAGLRLRVPGRRAHLPPEPGQEDPRVRLLHGECPARPGPAAAAEPPPGPVPTGRGREAHAEGGREGGAACPSPPRTASSPPRGAPGRRCPRCSRRRRYRGEARRPPLCVPARSRRGHTGAPSRQLT